jgi:hypothetical protein
MVELDKKVVEDLPDEGEKFRRTRERTFVADCENVCNKLSEVGSSVDKKDACVVRISEVYFTKWSGPETQIAIQNGQFPAGATRKVETNYFCSLGYDKCPVVRSFYQVRLQD